MTKLMSSMMPPSREAGTCSTTAGDGRGKEEAELRWGKESPRDSALLQPALLQPESLRTHRNLVEQAGGEVLGRQAAVHEGVCRVQGRG